MGSAIKSFGESVVWFMGVDRVTIVKARQMSEETTVSLSELYFLTAWAKLTNLSLNIKNIMT